MEAWEWSDELADMECGGGSSKLRALAVELHRQHDAIQAILGNVGLAASLARDERLADYRSKGMDWSQLQLGRSFKYMLSDGGWVRGTVGLIRGDDGAVPDLVVAWSRSGRVTSEVRMGLEDFVARFGGWLPDEG